MTTALEPIPQPRPVPLVGNLPDIDAEQGHPRDWWSWPEQYGPIFRIQLPGSDIAFLSSQELVDEVCDESRFDKALSGRAAQVRDFAGDGLFTADTRSRTGARRTGS